MPDFSQKSKFNKEANFTSILFGADAPLLETELNELQSILLEKIRDSVRAGFKDGVINSGEVTYDGSNFTMKDFLVVVDGDIFYVSSLTIPASNGQKIYLTVEEEEVDYQSILKKYGNRQETNIINHMYDDRVNQETSRRYVITYDLTTSKPEKGIEIGEIINGEFKATYFKNNKNYVTQEELESAIYDSMVKSVYDKNDDGIVDVAETVIGNEIQLGSYKLVYNSTTNSLDIEVVA